ncbi:MAG: NRPS [Piccolia ochrophora]|nr:MAG: NRPS [Piccolia ochrophora]
MSNPETPDGSEQVTPAQLTSFPDLQPDVLEHADEDQQGELSYALGQTHAHVPWEALILAWGRLLHSYTGNDPTTFHVDDRVVQVDATEGTFVTLEGEVARRKDVKSTGVFHVDGHNGRQRHEARLYLEVHPTNNGCTLVSNGLVPSDFLPQMGEQFMSIVEWQASGQAGPISWGSSSHVKRSKLNEACTPLTGPSRLQELLDLSGDGCAIDHLDSATRRWRYSYSDVGRRADALASRINEAFDKKTVYQGGDRIVPVLLPQSPELYITLLAILKAGAAFCPLNLDAPQERIKFIVGDTSAKVLITNGDFSDRVCWQDSPMVIVINEDVFSHPREDDARKESTKKPRAGLAYVMYTSGSTGTPKGVGVSHYAVTQSLLAHDRHIPEFNRFLQFAAPTFDVFVFEVFFTLFRRCVLVSGTRADLLNDLPSFMNDMDVDAAELTPTVAGSLIRTRNSVPQLKLLLTIGEMLTRSVIQEFGASSTRDGILYGMYGPTEAAVHCTLAPRLSATSKVGMIGVPLDTVSAFVITPATNATPSQSVPQVLPVGHIGELAVGGHQLAEGYLNRAEQTSAAFIDTDENDRLYRTGDKVRMLPNGSLECLGRIATGQVKLRGQRVELSEIEEVVYRQSGVRSATASVIRGILIVFYHDDSNSVTTDNVMDVCRQWLPSFMLPGDIVRLEDLPKLPSGKVDRKRLESEYGKSRGDGQETDVRKTEFQKRICSTLSEILKIEVKLNSSLTAVGVDSLTAIRVASQLRSLGSGVTTIDVLSAHTVQDLADVAQSMAGSDAIVPVGDAPGQSLPQSLKDAAVQRLEREGLLDNVADVISCTPVQVAMLTESTIEPHAYWNWVELETASNFTAAEIQAAFEKLADKVEILRSGFLQLDSGDSPFAQVVWRKMPQSSFTFPSALSYGLPLGNGDSFLHPLKIQITQRADQIQVLVHLHHALYDGWSLEHILNDLNVILTNKELPERPQYRKVVEYMTTSQKLPATSTSLNYWRDYLGTTKSYTLPNLNGHTRALYGLDTVCDEFSISTTKLNECARDLGFAPQTFFQAALTYILSCYVGSPDVLLGMVFSGRTIPVSGIEDIIGPCVSTLPIKVDISQLRTGTDLLHLLHDRNRQHLEYSLTPLREIKKSCGVNPGELLFDSVLIWQQTLQNDRDEPALLYQVNSRDYLEFNLVVEVEPKGEQIFAKANFQRAVLPKAQVEIILRQMDDLVNSLVRNSNGVVQKFNTCMKEEVLSLENTFPHHRKSTNSLSSLVELEAGSNPHKTALEVVRSYGNGESNIDRLSYHDLNVRANRIAHHLQELGVALDELVCICMEKSVDLYVSILATVKAGAGYLPLLPDTPLERLQYIIAEARVRVCLSQTSVQFAESLKSVKVVNIDEVKLHTYPDNNLHMEYQANNLAYAVFTSGSTGVPKGVLVTQENLLGNLDTLAALYPVSHDAKLLQACSQAFDVSVFEIFFAWHRGMCLCVTPKHILFKDIEDIIRGMGITHLSLTPTVAALVDPVKVPLVEFLVTSGEAVTAKVFNAWAGRGLYQGYGPSETTNICTVKPNVEVTDSINNIGRPLANTSAFVLSDERDFFPVPRGGVGEFCFGGDQVGRGYLNRPDLTSKQFLDHPRYGRLYRSGDYGRLLADGSLAFTGRQDDQIKLRGQRIELSEVNNTLLRSSAVVDCITIVHDHAASNGQQLVSFWVPSKTSSSDGERTIIDASRKTSLEELYTLLNSRLPSYMIPTALVPVHSLPMTGQGKIDKRKLASYLSNLSTEYFDSVTQDNRVEDLQEQWSDLEETIANGIAEITKVPKKEIRRNSSFFSFGLDSITSITLSRYLTERGYPQADVATILKNPSVTKLSSIISDSSHTSEDSFSMSFNESLSQEWRCKIKSSYETAGRVVQTILPCTPLQESMLSASDLANASAYCNQTLLSIHGDMRQLQSAWAVMVLRHEILRTSFVTTDNHKQPFAQVIVEQLTLPWHASTVQDENIEETLSDLKNKVGAYRQESLPPYLLAAISTPTKTWLAVTMHHALYDGEAMARLLYEIEVSYDGGNLPAPVSFEPFLEHIASTPADEADGFWARLLQNYRARQFPELIISPLPSDRLSKSSCECRFTVPNQLSWFESRCKALSITLLGACQATWARLLSVYLGDPDVCFGSVYSGRTLPIEGIDRLVAPCFNTVPVRVDLSRVDTNIGLMHLVTNVNHEILPFQASPLRRIQANNRGNGSALFDTLFLLQQPQGSLNEKLWSLEQDTGEMDVPIVVEVVPLKNRNALEIVLHAHRRIASEQECDIILKTFSQTLETCLQYPNARTADFGFLKQSLLSVSRSNIPVGPRDVVPDSPTSSHNHVGEDSLQKRRTSSLSPNRNPALVTGQTSQPLPLFGVGALWIIQAADRPDFDPLELTRSSLSDLGAQEHGSRARMIREGRVLYIAQDSAVQDSKTTSALDKDAAHEWTDDESTIRRVYSDLSGVPEQNIAHYTTLYQLGLDSINAVQVAARLRQLGKLASAGAVIECPSPTQLGSRLKGKAHSKPAPPQHFDFAAYDSKLRNPLLSKLKISSDDVEAIRPCTRAQTGMIAQYLNTEGSLYYNHVLLQLDHDINVDRLRGSWTAAMNTLEMLRTGFVTAHEQRDSFAMLTYRRGAMGLPWHGVGIVSNVEEAVQEQRMLSSSEVFDNFHRPPWGLVLMRTTSENYLHLSLHHALYDAQSLGVILDNVASHYKRGQASQASPVNPMLENILMSEETDSQGQEQFWQEQLKGSSSPRFPNMQPLHVDEPTPLVRSQAFSWSTNDLEQACKSQGISVQAAGQSAWARILSTYTGEDSVTFGTVWSGRTILDGTADVVFPCITTLPTTCSVIGRNADLVGKVMQSNQAMLKYQFTPLRSIQNWTGCFDRPLFDTVFVYQKQFARGNLAQAPWKMVDEAAGVDYVVSVELEPHDNGETHLRVSFKHHLVPEEQAELLLQQFDSTLIETITNPQGSCTGWSELPLSLLSKTPAQDPMITSRTTLLHTFVEDSAKTHPSHVAFEFATKILEDGVTRKQWTYKELNEEGNRIANLIIDQGVEQRSLIGICFDKCPEASFAILGILKAGCAYVALDHGAPIARKNFIIADSRAKLLLTTADFVRDLQNEVDVQTITLDGPSAAPPRCVASPQLKQVVEPSDLCYCLYTSGTTGTPKGCEITHENAVQALLSFQRLFAGHWDSESKWLQFASFHFDVSVLEQYWSWSVGICVVSAPRDLILEDLQGSIRNLGITHIDLTPSLARLLHPDDVPSLCKGVFITGGEQLKQEILDVWGSKACIYNGYGPTEATIGVTMYPRVPARGKPSNIGRQFDNVGTYVFSPTTPHLVPRGGVGELCVSGKLVGRGYLGRSDLSNERFPYIEKYGERVYRTGDLVRILYDGSFDFLGRQDAQVKLRGQRLEIEEIDEVIRTSTDFVRGVATVVMQHPAQNREQLISFLVIGDRHPSDGQGEVDWSPDSNRYITRVRQGCLAKLPGYMVPTFFVPVHSIPLSANNKADTKELKSLFGKLTSEDLQRLGRSEGGSGKAKSEIEEKLARVLSQMTQVATEDITSSSHIFEMGLDSISVIQLAQRLKEEGLVNARSSVIMTNPIVGLLATSLEEETISGRHGRKAQHMARQRIMAFAHKHTFDVAQTFDIKEDNIQVVAPCTALQEGIISRSLKSSEPLYFNTFSFDLSPDVKLPQLRAAWLEVIDHCQILRTQFFPTTDGFAQVVVEQLSPSIYMDTASEEEDHRILLHDLHRQWWQKNRDCLQRPFELIIVQTPIRNYMHLHIFHALYDGNSFPTLLEKVSGEYSKQTAMEYGPDFHEILPQGPLCEVDGAKNFWTSHLKGSKSPPFPSLTDSPTTAVSSVFVDVPIQPLEAVRRKLQTTHQALIQAGWMSVLREVFADSLTIGVVVSGRTIDAEGAGEVIGPLFNTIPFHLPSHDGESLGSMVTRCHNFNSEALPFQHTPLRSIMKWTKKAQLFDSLFVFQKDTKELEIALWKEWETESQADYPLAFEAVQRVDGKLRMTIVAQGGISNDETSRNILQQMTLAIQKLSESSEKPVNHNPRVPSKNDVDTHSETPQHQPKGIEETLSSFEWTPEACRIREEISKLADVEPATINEHASIIELGLDSIDAVKLSSRLKIAGLRLSVSSIMGSPTIAGMLQHTGVPEDVGVKASYISIDDTEERLRNHLRHKGQSLDGIEEVLPATPLQEAMVSEMISSNYSRYFNHDVLQLASNVDVGMLRRALETVMIHSPILRTSFAEIDDPDIPTAYCQVVHSTKELPIETTRPWNGNSVETTIDLAKKNAVKDALGRPAITLTFVEAKRTYLVVSIAHSLYDGISLALLHDDIRAAYHGAYKPRVGYRRVLEHILNSAGNDADQFWRRELASAKALPFPSRIGEDAPASRRVHRLEKTSNSNAKQIQSFCNSQKITLQAFGLACWAFVLGYYLKSLDVTFGVVLSGRDTEEAQEVMFPTMNTIAFRSILHGTRKAMLSDVQQHIASVMQYQHFPLRKTQRLAKVDRQRLFDTLFIFQRRPESRESNAVLYESIGGESEVEYAVCVEMEIVEDQLIWRTACDDSVLSGQEVQALLEQLDGVAHDMMKAPKSPAIDFAKDGVSICNLPSFVFDEGQNTAQTSQSAFEKKKPAPKSQWTETERKIREVLSKVSGTPESDITPDVTVYHLGIDSITAIKVASLLKKQAIYLGVSDIMKAETTENIASAAENRNENGRPTAQEETSTLTKDIQSTSWDSALTDAGIRPQDVAQFIPATAGQTYMLSMWQRSCGTMFYSTFSYEVSAVLDRRRLEEAWTNLTFRLPILRTTFVTTRLQKIPVVQVILKHPQNSLIWHNNGSLNRQRRTDLQVPPLTLFVEQCEEKTLLRLQIHHALYDGVSLPLLIKKLQDLYSSDPTASIEILDYEKFVLLRTSGDDVSARKEFWKRHLRGIRESSIVDSGSPSTFANRSEVYRPKALPSTARLETFARAKGLTVQAIFLTAYSKVLAKTLLQKESTSTIVIGIYLANRSDEIEGQSTLPAPTFNIVPLRIDVSRPLHETALAIQRDLQEISTLPNLAVSLWEIAEWTGVKITCIVNFLKLPDRDAEGVVEQSVRAIFSEVEPDWQHGRREVVKTDPESFIEPPAIKHNRVLDSYMSSIDIEATIRAGALDVGLFGPTDLLALDDADKVLDELVSELEGIQ